MSACGDCKVCCTVMAVEEIEKPAGKQCANLCQHGCGVYSTRPESCRGFECLWLQASTRGAPLPKGLRPDRCGVMFVPSAVSPNVLAAHCTSLKAFEHKAVQKPVKRWLEQGVWIARIVGNRRTIIALDTLTPSLKMPSS